jgi:predicted dehydrogenase
MTRVMQVGVGGFGEIWLDALRGLDGTARIAALVDRDPIALEAAAARAGVALRHCFTELDAALAAGLADVAVVVVPPEAHRAVAVDCLEAGVPVLVEKPLAGTRADCLALVETAQRTGLELAVSQNYRYRRPMETARRVIASGRLGAIGQGRVEFRHHYDFRGTFRETMEQPLVLDMAVHHFDLIRFVCGLEATRVHAHTWNPPWSQFVHDASAVCVFEMETGAHVVYEGSWHPRGQFTDWNCRWLLECERGYLRVDRDRVLMSADTDPHAPPEPGDEVEIPLVPLARQDQAAVLTDFVAAVAEGRPAPTTATDNLRTIEMVLGAVEAARAGGDVALDSHGVGSVGDGLRHQRGATGPARRDRGRDR